MPVLIFNYIRVSYIATTIYLSLIGDESMLILMILVFIKCTIYQEINTSKVEALFVKPFAACRHLYCY